MSPWEFKIGEMVQLKVDKPVRTMFSGKDEPPMKAHFMVIARYTDECIGGVQYHYGLRSFRAEENGTMRISELRVADFEVEAIQQPSAA